MDNEKLKTILKIGETIAVEFKRCGNGIESDVYETVCSFLNRFGGDLFLGVLDDGKVVGGVPRKAAPDLVRNFISCISNPVIFSPTTYLAPEIIEYEGKTIIHVHIPPSAEVHSFKKVIYDRVDDADVILDVAPAYLTDALLRRVNTDRYDDREIIQTNLIESYGRLMEFGRKHLLDKFFLEGDQRKSLREIITREIIANTLIHREYTSSYQAKFVIENDKLYVENANRSAQNGKITPKNMEPNPKNPIVASFFRNIGYADQLGSGVRNLFKYSKHYSGKEPEFIEGDVFKIIVPLDNSYMESITQSPTQSTTQSTTQLTTQSIDLTTEHLIMALIEEEPALSQKQIAERLEMNVNTVKYYMRKMQKEGRIRRVGSPRKGHWIVK